MLVLLFLICLVGFSQGETAKEAHDKEVTCIKACAKQPSILRCERACRNPISSSSHVGKKHHKPATPKRIHPVKVDRKPVKPASKLIKGRRVVLVRKR